MREAWLSDQQINDYFSQKHSSKGDPWGAFGGGLFGAGCVTALFVGGVIALPAMPAIATGVVIGGAIVGGGVVGSLAGAAAGAYLKEPIEGLFEQSTKVLQNFQGTNVPANTYLNNWITPFGSKIVRGAELLQEARNLGTGRPGSWENWFGGR